MNGGRARWSRVQNLRGPTVPLMVRTAVGVLVFAGGLMITALPGGAGNDSISPDHGPERVAAFVPPEFEDRSTDGVLLIEVPEGAHMAFAENKTEYVVPAVIHLNVGDRIVVDNQDSGPHMMFYAFVASGDTESIPFDSPGINTYSSGCAVNPKMNSFTTVIVSPYRALTGVGTLNYRQRIPWH